VPRDAIKGTKIQHVKVAKCWSNSFF